jgi:hypothetical protein
MDYLRIKEEIKEISAIAEGVPERFKEKCFEILLQNLISGKRGHQPLQDTHAEVSSAPSSGNKIPTPAPIKVFMQRTGVTEDDLKAILLYENGEIHFIKEPSHKKIAQGQIDWSLLLALKRGIVLNELSVDPEDVRSICIEKGFYDPANFASIFKRPKYAALFKNYLVPHGELQPLTNDGQVELGKLIKNLGGEF